MVVIGNYSMKVVGGLCEGARLLPAEAGFLEASS